MKRFSDFITEEVVPSALVQNGSIELDKEEVRASINMALAKVTADGSVTPYIALNRIQKALAYFHIILPKRVYLEGPKGVEVHELRQFGHKMGMTDQGEFVHEVPGKYYLFIQYGMNTPMSYGGQYSYPTMGGTFRVMAKVVDQIELDRLISMAELSLAEDCMDAEAQQKKAKMLAPHEMMKDVTSDEKKKGNKAAVGVSQKGLDEKWSQKYKDSINCSNPKGFSQKAHCASKKMEENIEEGDTPTSEKKSVNEDLRKWFREKWVRYDTKGNIKGPCAREEGEGKPKCRPLSSARAMSKDERAKSARRKRRQDPVADRPGKGGKPIMVQTEETLMEKNVPTNPALWARAKAQARAKFDVYPSAYANGWASKWYKSKGGGWKSAANESVEEACWDTHRQEGMKKKGGKMVPNCVPKEETISEKAPPGAKFERMVKHIKKGYSKGGLTTKEKSIAYATAWKAKNRQDEELKFDPSTETPKNS